MASIQISNVILPPIEQSHAISTYDITITDSTVTSVAPHVPTPSDSPPSLLLPTLCHPHIHLDKPYLLTCNLPRGSGRDLPDYSDLAPQTGSFQEALTNTSEAKTRFTSDDLYLRGSQLLASSYTQGVTSARCFVEVDHVTQFKTLEAGLRLKADFAAPRPGHPHGLVDVQLCLFAQDPIFSSEHGDENRQLLEAAVATYAGKGVSVLGSTPYVETSRKASLANISWAINTALKYSLHLDFHLDYSLATTSEEALVWHVLSTLTSSPWPRHPNSNENKTVVLGHCTALTNFSSSSLHTLASQIHSNNLPVFFVGLPTSDIYMMGRSTTSSPVPINSSPSTTTAPSSSSSPPDLKPLSRPRGTLNIPSLTKDFGIKACLGVNNVGNAFTPFGTGDPLTLASWAVGLYHAGTSDDARLLYEAISTRAREAIGLQSNSSEVAEGESHGTGGVGAGSGSGSGHEWWSIQPATRVPKHGLLLVRNEEWVGCPGHLGVKIPARLRRCLRDVVWDVPDRGLRSVVG